MGIKAVKFGGTSLCSAAQMKKAAEIVLADAARRIVVVSAPGKCSHEDEKITDLLYRCYEETDESARAQLFARVRARFDGIIADLGLLLDFSEEYAAIMSAVGYGGRDYFVSRGEYLCAKLFAAFLGFSFLDAEECIFFRGDGTFDDKKTKTVLAARLRKVDGVVIPGFYGKMPNDTIRTFPRGGSDITGAIAADAAGAYLYENFTDVSGFLVADPTVVEDPEPVAVMSYGELRRLSYMGAAVLHEDSIFPVRASGIPINIRNTDRPDDPGTMVVPHKQTSGRLAGIAGRGGYVAIRVARDKIGEDAAALRYLLGIFERRGISVLAVPRSVDAVGVVVKRQDVAGRQDYILNEICQCTEPEAVTLTESVALLCVVGERMGVTLLPRIFGALAKLGVCPLLLDSGADDLGVTLGLPEEALADAIRAIYRAVI